MNESKAKPLTTAQRAALEWLNEPRRQFNPVQRWVMSPSRSELRMLTILSKRNPSLVEFSETRMFARLTKAGRAALKEASDVQPADS